MNDEQPTGPASGRTTQRFWNEQRIRRYALVLAGLLTLGVSATSAYTLTFLIRADGQIDKIEASELPDIVEEPEDPLEPINVLILGSDTREVLTPEEQVTKGTGDDVEGERSDTIILARFDPQEEHAMLLHFPRDLRVEIPGHGTDKINAAFTLGGPNLTIKTIRQLTGIPVHHYLEVNFNSFRDIVNALGGVEICVDRPMFDELAELHLPRAGCYNMKGDTALAFVRARNVEGDLIPDFARISRQQQFIRSVMNEVFSIGSIARIPSLVETAARNVTTDHDITVTDLIDYGRELQGLAEVDPSGASTVDLRVVPSIPQTIDGISYVVALPEAEQLFQRIRQGRDLGDLGAAPTEGVPPSPAQILTKVLEAGEKKVATRVENLLRDGGFIVLQRDVRPPRAKSEIVYAPGAEDRAEIVAGFFPDLPLRQGGETILGDAQVAVVIGTDYQGPQR